MINNNPKMRKFLKVIFKNSVSTSQQMVNVTDYHVVVSCFKALQGH